MVLGHIQTSINKDTYDTIFNNSAFIINKFVTCLTLYSSFFSLNACNVPKWYLRKK